MLAGRRLGIYSKGQGTHVNTTVNKICSIIAQYVKENRPLTRVWQAVVQSAWYAEQLSHSLMGYFAEMDAKNGPPAAGVVALKCPII